MNYFTVYSFLSSIFKGLISMLSSGKVFIAIVLAINIPATMFFSGINTLPVYLKLFPADTDVNKKEAKVNIHDLAKLRKPIIIAHRGYSAKAPENTIASFSAALKTGVPVMELDVTTTKDGKLIIIHDDTLERTTNGKGEVVDYTMEELKKLDAGGWFDEKFKGEQLPTLGEVLDKFGNKILINIEIKSPPKPDTEVTEKVVGLIKKKNLESAVIVSSFDYDVLKKVHKLDDKLIIGVLSDLEDLNNTDIVELTKSLHGVTFNPCSRGVKKEYVDKLHEAGLMVMPWFYGSDDTHENVQAVIDMGVDGVFTNHVDIIQFL